MNFFAAFFFLITAYFLCTVQRKWAPVPLLVGSCYMTLGQGIEIGPISLPIFRMLMGVGLLRVIIKQERIIGSLNRIDKAMIFLAAWMIFASFFHDGLDASGPLFMSGQLFNILLIYFLIRTWTQGSEELTDLVKIIALLLLPVAVAMVLEKSTGKNLLSVFGGVPENVLNRAGNFRAQGPFRHPILAGTVGATCIPLFVGIYRKHSVIATIGIASGLVMVLASSSSGPVMSLLAGTFALMLWNFRHLTRLMVGCSVSAYFLLMLMMEKPPYYLISKIDISGGSTGWHRYFLINQTFNHLNEWWLFGTDHTRHWMPNQGIAFSINHTDITNYYIAFGVMGGLPAMLIMIYALITAFRWVCEIQSDPRMIRDQRDFMVWAFGSGLFAHAATSISVSYFDQSMLFFWLNIAVISSLYSTAKIQTPSASNASEDPDLCYKIKQNLHI
jgi:hypothetical protein